MTTGVCKGVGLGLAWTKTASIVLHLQCDDDTNGEGVVGVAGCTDQLIIITNRSLC